MRTVSPIRDRKKIRSLFQLLKGTDDRYAIIFLFGVSTALRISDILSLKYEDIFTRRGNFREFVSLPEKKTRKKKNFKIPSSLRREIKKYVKKHKIKEGDYLFFSKRHPDHTHPIDRVTVWKKLKKAAQALGIQKFGTHSLRKTFGYHFYKQTHDIATLMKLMNHSSPEVTLRYIGIEEEDLSDAYQKMSDLYNI